mgnify:CR=1 FL=1
MADPTNNIFTQYLENENYKSRTLNSMPIKLADKGGLIVFPPGLGGTPDVNNVKNDNRTIPFTLFMPYKRNKGFAGAYSLQSGNALYDTLPTPTYAIALPTPTSALKTNYTATYNAFEIGQALGAGLSGIDTKNIDDAMRKLDYDSVKKAAREAIDNGEAIFRGAKDTIFTDIAKAVASKITLGQFPTEAFNLAKGATNPYTENIFKNIERRVHEFSYVFMPRNDKESAIIDNIITLFKYSMHPRTGTGESNDTNKGFFEFPFEFQITHSNQDTTFTLLPSVLSSLDVDYGGGTDSPKFLNPLDNGLQYPARITLNMRFEEMVLLSRERIAQDNNKFAFFSEDISETQNKKVRRYRF